MGTQHNVMEAKTKADSRLTLCGEVKDSDGPICMVHLTVQRSEHVDIYEKGTVQDLEVIRSERFTDKECMRQRLSPIVDIVTDRLMSSINIKQEEIEQQIFNDNFGIPIEHIKKELLEDIKFTHDGLTGGEATMEGRSGVVNIAEKDMLKREQYIKQEESHTGVNVKITASKDVGLHVATRRRTHAETRRRTTQGKNTGKQRMNGETNTNINVLRHNEQAAVTQESRTTPVSCGIVTNGGDKSSGDDRARAETAAAGDGCGGELDDRHRAVRRAEQCHRTKRKTDRKCTTSRRRRFGGTRVVDKRTDTHPGRHRLECDVCQRRFAQKRHLVDHLRRHAGEKPFQCSICRRKFTTEGSLKGHLRRHTGEKQFECAICRRRFADKSNLSQHLKTHTGERPFECAICRRSFAFKCNLVGHLNTHTGDKRFKCAICQRGYPDQYRLNTHMKIHTEEKQIKCVICQQVFTERGSLKRHLRIHTGEKPFKCSICLRCFTEQGSLKIHLRMHTGEKPYECTICHRHFSVKANWKTHIKMHTGEKMFECVICQRKFTDQSNLNKHLRTHSGKKPFECAICHRNFSVKSNLKSHLTTHTGEKPFECAVCRRTFTQKCNLKVHLRTH